MKCHKMFIFAERSGKLCKQNEFIVSSIKTNLQTRSKSTQYKKGKGVNCLTFDFDSELGSTIY